MVPLGTRLGGVALAGALALMGACVDPKPSSPSPADIAAIDLTPEHTVTVDEDGFHPAVLQVQAGDVVLLVNEGSGPHSFTAEERFDTGRLHPGDDTTLVLTEPEEIPYVDLVHPEHGATITVVARPGS
jgi:plastocyanin